MTIEDEMTQLKVDNRWLMSTVNALVSRCTALEAHNKAQESCVICTDQIMHDYGGDGPTNLDHYLGLMSDDIRAIQVITKILANKAT